LDDPIITGNPGKTIFYKLWIKLIARLSPKQVGYRGFNLNSQFVYPGITGWNLFRLPGVIASAFGLNYLRGGLSFLYRLFFRKFV